LIFEAPTVSELNGLTKANLLAVALHYKLKKEALQYQEIIPREGDLSEPTMTGEELLTLRWLEMQEKEKERESQLPSA